MDYKILVINPGSTSTKVSIFINDKEIFNQDLIHSEDELKSLKTIEDQFLYRKKLVTDAIKNQLFNRQLNAVAARGGLLRPMPSGTYIVNELMTSELLASKKFHASNLGPLLAKEFRDQYDIPAFIVDPVVVDELQEVARVSGYNGVKRKSLFHALNQKAVARKLAVKLNKKYHDTNIVVAHMGGGISVGAHESGKIIDVNNGFDGEGPFSPERSGTLPMGDVIRMCYSGKYTEKDMHKRIVGKGGLMSYFGISDTREVEKMANRGDYKAGLVLQAMAYQVSKEIGACAVVLNGKVDGIALTGGIAHSARITNMIKDRVQFIAPVHMFPGEMEMEALAGGALRVLTGEEEANDYI